MDLNTCEGCGLAGCNGCDGECVPEVDAECPDCGREDCDGHDYDDDRDHDLDFADPGGRSALRAASASNPRDLPCPTCGAENVLTPADVAHGYQCDRCADRDEGRFGDY